MSQKKRKEGKPRYSKVLVYFANHLYIQVLPTGLDNTVKENWNMNTYSGDYIKSEPE